MSQQQGQKTIKSIEDFIKSYSAPLEKSAIGTIRPVFLPVGKICAVEEVLKSKDETNNSLIVHYQYEATTLKTKLFQ